uniref:Uncharacterized protein n=1 Tax=Sphaerodactylus townsendi TaxID=933632 RepID=A0ACB8FP98_9SAUR
MYPMPLMSSQGGKEIYVHTNAFICSYSSVHAICLPHCQIPDCKPLGARIYQFHMLVKCNSGKEGKKEQGDQSATDFEPSIEITHYLHMLHWKVCNLMVLY